MKKALVILMAFALLFAMGSMALAKQEPVPPGGKGNIVSNEYTFGSTWDDGYGNTMDVAAKDWDEKERDITTGRTYVGETSSTHVYGTWNSPYTIGVDGYNYNDAQDYTDAGVQVDGVYTSGPHGGYLTSTHRCRECHAVHRAAGKFKLLRSDTRFEACDWCHGTGAGSGYNIQMDNDDLYTTEYNVGHTMGFGIDSGKWKAPDDTYPAFTPNFWQGGFSCFDCHSPHANPARMLGFDDDGNIGGIPAISGAAPGTGMTIGSLPTWIYNGQYYGVADAGNENWAGRLKSTNNPQGVDKPFWLSGSWLLIKNPDKEIASTTTVGVSGILIPGGSMGAFTTTTTPVTVAEGQEIPDAVTADLKEFDPAKGYPVNKFATDWNTPIGNAKTLWKTAAGGLTGSFTSGTGEAYGELGFAIRRSDMMNNVTGYSEPRAIFDASGQVVGSESATLAQGGQPCEVWSVNEFCSDCHDGNAGLHTVQAPLFSEDRALRSQGSDADNWRGNYDLAYGHDVQPRH